MSFDSDRFRHVLGHFPTGVTIVCGMAGDEPTGLTIGSFASVSLDPPLVGFFPMATSDTWEAIAPSGSFCVNVLGAQHSAICWRFAKHGLDDRFDDLAWHASAATGSPIIDDAVAWIDCVTEDVHTVGDHYFVLGRVMDLRESAEAAQPLLVYRGKLGGFILQSP